MRLIHRDRTEATLPQMSGHAHACVDEAGIVTVDIAKRPPQPVLVAWHRDDVDVAGHQAIRPGRDLRMRRGIGQQIEIQLIVAVLEEDRLAPIAALGDMVRNAPGARCGGDEPWPEASEIDRLNKGVIARHRN